MVRAMVLAAEKTESPACDASMMHDPTVKMLTMPIFEIEQTEPPAVTLVVMGKPLDADAFRTKSGPPSSTVAGCGKEMA